MHPISSLRCFSTLITYTDHIKYGDTSNVLTFSMMSVCLVCFCFQSRDAQDCRVLHWRRPGGQILHSVQHGGQSGLWGLCLWAWMGGEITHQIHFESVVSGCHVLWLSEHMEVYVSLSFRWICPLTVGLWVVCREMAAQVAQHHITLPPMWRSSSMCRLACLLTRMTPSLKR